MNETPEERCLQTLDACLSARKAWGKDILSGEDPAEAHRKADEALCELLISLGHEKVVEKFRSLDKWYE